MPRTARVISFSTTSRMAEDIDRIAMEEGRTRSELIREAVRHYSASDRSSHELARELGVAYGAGRTSGATAVGLPGLVSVISVRSEIRKLCARVGLVRLWLYGSAVREDFLPDRSDYDFIAEWQPSDDRAVVVDDFLALQNGLSELLGSKIDLGEAGLVKNPYLRKAFEEEKLLIYDAT